LDSRIKNLRDQQADIQAQLAQLLPLKYGPNIKLELEMLRHKLLVLEAYARDHSKMPSSSILTPNWHLPFARGRSPTEGGQ
jgi:hypothetical protein